MSIPLLTYPTSAANTGQTLWAELASTILPNGIFPNVNNSVNVYGDSTGLNVKVDTGRLIVGGFWADVPSLQTVSPFATPDASNNRIDRLVARLDTSAAAQISLVIIQGTPGVSPVAPAYGANDLPLARVQIRKLPNSTIAATDVTQDFIATGTSSIPIGATIPFAGATAPTGWLICDGSAVSRSSYPFLFNAISTTYGVGDGTTTFNLPDGRHKFIRGASGDLGSASGQDAVTLTPGMIMAGVPAGFEFVLSSGTTEANNVPANPGGAGNTQVTFLNVPTAQVPTIPSYLSLNQIIKAY